MPDFLQIKNFSCGYPERFILQDITFGINTGMFAGIIGPNGSGKTTLFKGVLGELTLRSGSLEMKNQNISLMTNKEKARNLAIVTQHIDVGNITVEDYVLMGRLPHKNPFQFFETKEDIEIAYKYMKLTDVWHLKDKLMSRLSGGEQQLAGIARALTQEPKLLLLDEPTSHLDISHQVQILNLIQQLNHDLNLTVLMVIHDLNLAGEYCDFLVMMNEGAIHKKGTPDEVLTYKNIEEVYKTVVITQKNPLSGKPAIFLVSERVLRDKNLKSKDSS